MHFSFKELLPPKSPNYYLVCPKNRCEHSNADAPVLSESRASLIEKWKAMIKKQPRTKMVAQNNKEHLYQYVQYSWLFRFPDFIYVQFFKVEGNKSSLAIYSYSKYGYYDFGVNKRRVQNYIQHLKK